MSRWTVVILLALSACDNKQDTNPPAPSATTAPTPVMTADAAPTASSGANVTRAERPIPMNEHMVSSHAPVEQQQKAIAYMMSMRAPGPGDANSDPAYAKDLAEKLKPISLSLDPGGDKGTLNHVDVIADGREIDMLMSLGCDEKTPNKAVVQRLSTPFATLALHGVFVVQCHDTKVQCFQSTRNPDDVLCTTAPRKK